MRSFVLDTNIYISYFVDRNPVQFRQAQKYFLDLEEKKIKIVLPDLVLAEIVYVLEKGYKVGRGEICEVLLPLIAETNLEMNKKEVILNSLSKYENNILDFVDCYLQALQENEEMDLVSFDKGLQTKV